MRSTGLKSRPPVVGIVGNHYLIEGSYPVHAGGAMNSEAVRDVSRAVPMIIPSDPDLVSVEDLLEVCDGFLLTGGRANVHPDEYGEAETSAHGTFDRARDSIAIGLSRACVQRGQPIFAVCRGFQELNVAMGGTLYPEIRELEGRMNHRMTPNGTLAEKFGLRHEVTLEAGGVFHRLLGAERIMTNTLHGQGVKTPGDRVVIEGWAGDGTPEAMSIKDAPGFALGVQWHPEYEAGQDPVSRALFEAFGDAVRLWAEGGEAAQLRQVS